MDSMTTNVEEVIALVTESITTYGLSVIGAIALLIFGVMAAGWTERMVSKGLSKTKKIDDILRGFFSSMARYTVLILVFIAVLDQFGVETTSFIAVLGAAGLAIGLALQGTLSNVAAGVMLLVFRPFKVGDFVEVGGLSGSIDRVTLFFTEMHTGDNIHMIMPNAQIWGGSIKNYSHHPKRRFDMVVGVGYEVDLNKAMDLFTGIVNKDVRAHGDPEPLVVIQSLGESSVDILIRTWCDSSDYWGLQFDLNKAIKEACDENNISIPYPHRTVELIQAPE